MWMLPQYLHINKKSDDDDDDDDDDDGTMFPAICQKSSVLILSIYWSRHV